MLDGASRARVDGVGDAAAVHLAIVPVVAGGGDSCILQREDRMRRPALGVRRLDRNGPGLAVWPHTHRPHLAVNPYESGGNPMIAQGLGQAVDAIALGDTVEVELEGVGVLSNPVIAEQ